MRPNHEQAIGTQPNPSDLTRLSPCASVFEYYTQQPQTSHITPQQAGEIFSTVRPRLGVAHHLTVNAASRAAIIQDIRQKYPKASHCATCVIRSSYVMM